MSCEFCREEKDILSGSIDKLDSCVFIAGDEEKVALGYLKQFFNSEKIRVFIDRGHLRITIGDDIGCLDHSEDYTKINYCPKCGEKIED